MRKELENSYTDLANGSVGVRALTPEGQIIEFELLANDLALEIKHTDSQGSPKVSLAILRPMVSSVTRLDGLMPSDLHVIYLAALNCYSGLSTLDLLTKTMSAKEEEIVSFLREKILPTGHFSVVEHTKPAMLIDGVSRACSHQIVRHRHFSFSQQSQRYVDSAKPVRGKEQIVFPFIIPPSIRANPAFVGEYVAKIKEALSGYYSLRASGVFPEDARFLFPNAAATRLVMSGNHRVWMEMIPKRTCATAQWEIDMVVTEVSRQLWEKDTVFYESIGPACSTTRCNQGKRGCRSPLNAPLSAFFDRKKYPHDHLVFGMR